MSLLLQSSFGPEVGNLQRFLNRFTDANLSIDEKFGVKTQMALWTWQAKMHIPVTGVFDDRDRTVALTQGFVPFVQARNFSPVWPSSRSIRLIVIHTMESLEKPGMALNVARWFASENAPKASAHYCIDMVDTIQCVRDMDVAWHAPGANNDGIGVEHAGMAKQTPVEWGDMASQRILWRSAELVAKLCDRYSIAPIRLIGLQVKDKFRTGICGHSDVSQAYGGTHWDPGPAFPWTQYLQLVRGKL